MSLEEGARRKDEVLTSSTSLCPSGFFVRSSFFSKNPWGRAGVAPPLGLLHVARRGHPQGSTRAEEGEAVLLALTRYSFPVWFTQHCPPLAPASPGGPPLLLSPTDE